MGRHYINIIAVNNSVGSINGKEQEYAKRIITYQRQYAIYLLIKGTTVSETTVSFAKIMSNILESINQAASIRYLVTSTSISSP